MNRIIEDYKNNKITLEKTILKLDLANKTNNKKNEGVIYTPRYIADYIVSGLDYDIDKTILEPSVGHGIFIFSLIEFVKKKFKLDKKELKYWFENKVFCFDINEQNINDFKKLLTIYFEKNDIINIDMKNIKKEDTLFYNFTNNFDFSFGNPPYVRTKNLELDYLKKIREKYKSCLSGNVDLFYSFIELMSNISTVSSFIVPNSYIYNKSAKEIRIILKENIESVVDFKNLLIFENARTYTSIYKTNKNKKNDFVLYKENLENEFCKYNRLDLDDKQWCFMDTGVNKNGRSLLDLYPYYGNIATLRDSLYIIEDPEIKQIDNVDYYKKDYNNKTYLIETNLCSDFYKITKYKKKHKIIFPYENNKIITESDLKKTYPFAYSYFESIKNELSKRDRGKTDKYENWYAYGRRQGITKKNEEFFLLLPLMSCGEYKCKKIKTRDNFLTTSGFVLGFENENEANKVKEIIESDLFYSYLKIKGKRWAGKKPYYSFTKTHLKDFLI